MEKIRDKCKSQKIFNHLCDEIIMETTFQNIAEIVEKKIETSNKDIFISDLFTDLGQFSKIDQFHEILREVP